MATSENKKRMIKLSDLVKKREFAVGIATVAAVAAGALLLFRGAINQPSNTNMAGESEVSKVVYQDNEKVVSPTQEPQKEQVSQIKKLADTSGEYVTIVQSGDNYWKISERSCGTGRYYLAIQAINGNKPLHPGNLVLVTCEY